MTRLGNGTLVAGGMAAALLVASCGGGGGGGGVNSTPAPPSSTTTTPTVPTTPTPPVTTVPSPPTSTADPEYSRSNGAAQANAIAAYTQGDAGQGITAAIIDTGINASDPEFSGRISAASADVAGSRGISDADGHGTSVAAVLGAARNGSGIEGIAYGATLAMFRADTPGSCTAGNFDSCGFSDSTIARGVNDAVAAGAKVINMSLGGSPASAPLQSAIEQAAAHGIITVISAGNDGGAQPDQLAQIASDPNVHGLVIIAGALDASNNIASFSDQAGSYGAYYLGALGVNVRSFDQTGQYFLFSGTSYSAPLIAGAVTLLEEAFPNLTPAQIVHLLYTTADDLGAAGVDTTFGNGALDLTRAFQPQGSTALAGSATPISLASNASLSAPMGDAGQGTLAAVVLDGYHRAYGVNLAGTVHHASPDLKLEPALQGGGWSREQAFGSGIASLSLVGSADPAMTRRAVAGMAASPLGKSSVVALGFGESGAALSARLSGEDAPAFLAAADPVADLGFERSAGQAVALRRLVGRWGIRFSAEHGYALAANTDPNARLGGRWDRHGYDALSIGADRIVGPLHLSLGASELVEAHSVLGAEFGGALGGQGATSWFLDAGADLTPGGGWRLAVRARQGLTRVAPGGAMAGAATLRSAAMSFDVSRDGAFVRGDRLAIRVAQPLRVTGGGLDLSLPVSYDYASGAVGYAVERLGLAPSGHELDAEASYGIGVGGGWFGANLYWRRDPGNIAALPDDVGTALRYRLDF